MMSSLVSGGLEAGLNARNSTMLMWVTLNFGGSAQAGQVYNYFSGSSGYFSNGYAGYYVSGTPPFGYPYYGMLGIVNLRTGEMDIMSGSPLPSVTQLLNFADAANP